MSWIVTGTQKYHAAVDPDARAYIQAVEAADNQYLETAVASAIDTFVLGCKADGIWNAIKASCILAGARTLTGALTPLVGSAPTNWNGNFVSGDYSRKDGLLGNGSNKALISNYAHDAAGQNDRHMAVYVSQLYSGASTTRFVDDGNGATTGGSHLRNDSNTFTVRIAATNITGVVQTPAIGFLGASRNNSSNYTRRAGGSTGSVNDTSQTPISSTYIIFGRGANGVPTSASNLEFVDGALSFYSLGEFLDLALLDARVTTLINAFDAAI